MEGWMAAVNAIMLPKDSPFKSTDQVPLLEGLADDAQVEGQKGASSDEEKGVESLESRELSKKINSHVVVLNDDQPRTAGTTLDRIA